MERKVVWRGSDAQHRGQTPDVQTLLDLTDPFDPLDANAYTPEDIYTDTYRPEEIVANPDLVDEDEKYADPDDVGEGPSGPPPLYYDGSDELPDIPDREAITKRDMKTYTLVRTQIDTRKPILFMPTDIEEQNEYSGGDPVHRLHMFGSLIDGSKAHVIMTDVDVFFAVRQPDTMPKSAQERKTEMGEWFREHLRRMMFEHKLTCIKVEKKSGFPLFGYSETKCEYVRLYFNDLKTRKEAIEVVRSYGLETALDDRSSHYRKVARERGMPLTDWLIMKDYEYSAGRTEKDPLCAHVFRIAKVQPLVPPMGSEDERKKGAAARASSEILQRDRTLVEAWDIETYTSRKAGDLLPVSENKEDVVFLITLSYFWKDSTTPLVQFALVDKKTHPDSRWITIVCGSEQNVLRAVALVRNRMAPDISLSFNGSQYDDPFIIGKYKQYDDLAWMYNKISALPRKKITDSDVFQWNYKNSRIKISADQAPFESKYLKVPGFVPIDVRVYFMKLYPKSETSNKSSLNFYLKKCGLPSKADMPINRMWRGYREGEPEMMRKIIHYCIIDSNRCQLLMHKVNAINELRDVSTLAFTSFADAHYYAGGMKVCNLTYAYAMLRDIMFSTITKQVSEKGKYPGAWVFPPKKGLENERPVTGVDASSLYPSIIMVYNLSPEKFALSCEKAEALRAKGKNLHAVEFEYNGRMIRDWAVRHNDKQEDIGLFPFILIDLFAKRKALKKDLEVLQMQKEAMELVYGTAKKSKVSNFEAMKMIVNSDEECLADLAEEKSKEAEEERKKVKARLDTLKPILAPGNAKQSEKTLDDKFSDVSFKYSLLNAKQKAVKVYMNTFYGESGNQLSPLFLLALSGGVTSAGQIIIKEACKFALSKDFKLKYGDSVTGDTALVLRENGIVRTARIDEIVDEKDWAATENDKEEAKVPNGLEVWSDTGFTPIVRVIRHKTDKPIKRVLTHTGVVDVTTDHSLLRPDGEEVSPSDVAVGEELMHKDNADIVNILYDTNDETIQSKEEAFAMGMFAAEGSCGRYSTLR